MQPKARLWLLSLTAGAAFSLAWGQWCPWLRWECEKSAFVCRPVRYRACCSAVAANSTPTAANCNGTSADLKQLVYSSVSLTYSPPFYCDATINSTAIYCSSRYALYPSSANDSLWCAWAYWSAWTDISGSGNCGTAWQRQRSRQRVCECPPPTPSNRSLSFACNANATDGGISVLVGVDGLSYMSQTESNLVTVATAPACTSPTTSSPATTVAATTAETSLVTTNTVATKIATNMDTATVPTTTTKRDTTTAVASITTEAAVSNITSATISADSTDASSKWIIPLILLLLTVTFALAGYSLGRLYFWRSRIGHQRPSGAGEEDGKASEGAATGSEQLTLSTDLCSDGSNACAAAFDAYEGTADAATAHHSTWDGRTGRRIFVESALLVRLAPLYATGSEQWSLSHTAQQHLTPIFSTSVSSCSGDKYTCRSTAQQPPAPEI